MARNVTFSGHLQQDIESWLQDLSVEADVLLGEIMQEEVSITDSNAEEFRDALRKFDVALEAVTALRKHRAALRPQNEHIPIYGVTNGRGRVIA